MLEMILLSSKYVVLVTPALVVDEIRNASNMELKEISSIIHSISSKYANVSLLNMQKVFESHLE